MARTYIFVCPNMKDTAISQMFKAFSDPTRLRIMHLLLDGEWCVGDLVELLEVERSAVVGAHGDQALPGVGRSSALVWAAAGGTVPIETTYFRAASTGMLRAMTSDLGIIKKKPDVGLGVVGT